MPFSVRVHCTYQLCLDIIHGYLSDNFCNKDILIFPLIVALFSDLE